MDCNMKMNNLKLKAEKLVKFLAVIFNPNLTFEDHITEKITKLLFS